MDALDLHSIERDARRQALLRLDAGAHIADLEQDLYELALDARMYRAWARDDSVGERVRWRARELEARERGLRSALEDWRSR